MYNEMQQINIVTISTHTEQARATLQVMCIAPGKAEKYRVFLFSSKKYVVDFNSNKNPQCRFLWRNKNIMWIPPHT